MVCILYSRAAQFRLVSEGNLSRNGTQVAVRPGDDAQATSYLKAPRFGACSQSSTLRPSRLVGQALHNECVPGLSACSKGDY